jgi:hypothetical protein
MRSQAGADRGGAVRVSSAAGCSSAQAPVIHRALTPQIRRTRRIGRKFYEAEGNHDELFPPFVANFRLFEIQGALK